MQIGRSKLYCFDMRIQIHFLELTHDSHPSVSRSLAGSRTSDRAVSQLLSAGMHQSDIQIRCSQVHAAMLAQPQRGNFLSPLASSSLECRSRVTFPQAQSYCQQQVIQSQLTHGAWITSSYMLLQSYIMQVSSRVQSGMEMRWYLCRTRIKHKKACRWDVALSWCTYILTSHAFGHFVPHSTCYLELLHMSLDDSAARDDKAFWLGEFCHALAHRSTGQGHSARHALVTQACCMHNTVWFHDEWTFWLDSCGLQSSLLNVDQLTGLKKTFARQQPIMNIVMLAWPENPRADAYRFGTMALRQFY